MSFIHQVWQTHKELWFPGALGIYKYITQEKKEEHLNKIKENKK